MRVVHFTLGSMNPDAANGINQVVAGLAKYGNRLPGCEVAVVTCKRACGPPMQVERNGFSVTVCPSTSEVIHALKRATRLPDVVHLHNVWTQHNDVIARWCRKTGVPYFVTPHAGLLEDRVARSRPALKSVYHSLRQRCTLDNAAGIHALTEEEAFEIRRYTHNSNVFSLPNGIDPEANWVGMRGESAIGHKSARCKASQSHEGTRFLYCGRFAPEKNIAALVDAFLLLQQDSTTPLELALAGPLCKTAHALQARVDRVHDAGITFLGSVAGQKKTDAFASAHVYVQPALSEGFSMSIIEAMAARLPCLLTRSCGMSYFMRHDCFEMMETDVQGIAQGLERMLLRRGDWPDMSNRALRLVESQFNWPAIAERLLQIYRDVS